VAAARGKNVGKNSAYSFARLRRAQSVRATATHSLRSFAAENRLGDDLTDVPSADSNHAFCFDF
jgi:hypothetical protein